MSIRTLYFEYQQGQSILDHMETSELIELAQQTAIHPTQFEQWLNDTTISVSAIDEFRLWVQCHHSENHICFTITDLPATHPTLIQAFTPEDEGEAYSFPKREIVELSDMKVAVSQHAPNLLIECILIALNELFFKHFQMYVIQDANLAAWGQFKQMWIRGSIVEHRHVDSTSYSLFINPVLL